MSVHWIDTHTDKFYKALRALEEIGLVEPSDYDHQTKECHENNAKIRKRIPKIQKAIKAIRAELKSRL